MKKLLALVSLVASVACGVTLPPAQPGPTPAPPAAQFTERTLAVRVNGQGPGVHPVKDCAVVLELPLSGTFRASTTSDGYAAWLVRIPDPDPGGGLNAHAIVACPGYLQLEDRFVIAALGNQDITFGGPTAEGNQPLLRDGPVLAPLPFPFNAETGFVSVAGKFFRVNGQAWEWRGASSFMLFARYLRGEDITPRLLEARTFGINILRVFGRVLGSGWPDFPEFANPENDPQYATKLGAFFDLLATHGLRVEFVPLTYQARSDAVARAQLQQAYDVAAGRWNVVIEGANEPGINDIDVVSIYVGVDRHGVVSSYGVYDLECDGVHICTLPMLDYVTVHTSRGDQWPRQVKDLLEYREGFGCGDPANPECNRLSWFGGTHRPTVGDEPMGADEVNQPGRRSNVASDFAQAFAVCVIYSAGCTFHSEAGLRANPWGQNQRMALASILEVWKFLPATAQEGSYTRGGLGDLPVRWSETPEPSLRTFGSIRGDTAWAVDVRPAPGRQLSAAPGWRVDAAILNGTVARLVR